MRIAPATLAVALALPAFADVAAPKDNIKGERKGVKEAPKKGDEHADNQTVFGSWRTVDYRDEKQGGMGDCYLLSTLADLAYQDPADIPAHHFVHDAHGALTVFHEGGKELVGVIFKTVSGGKVTDHVVKVENKLYLKDGKPVFAHADHSMVFALLEEAYAKFRDSQHGKDDDSHKGMNKIGNGGNPAHVMEALTGKPAHTVNIPVDPKKADEIWKLVSQANAGHLVAAGTSADGKEWHTRIQTAVAKGLLDPQLGKATMDARGLVEAHAYSIFGTRTAQAHGKDGKPQRLVHLRNPWGSKVPKGATQEGLHNGEFELKLEEFIAYYDQAYVGAAVGTRHHAAH